MGHSYEASKKLALKTILILAAVTILEVLFALLAKGHIVEGFYIKPIFIALVMIAGSLYKAYLVIFEFMHMKYEMPSLVKTVLLPMLLLVWGIIAFFQEGSAWKNRRDQIKDKNKLEVGESAPIGHHYILKKEDIENI
ncbi:MAG: cytochrome C oxidase subunit IV family protein [Bacteroidota bacterium]